MKSNRIKSAALKGSSDARVNPSDKDQVSGLFPQVKSTEILQASSNIGAAKTALGLREKRLDEGFGRFGFGDRPGLPPPPGEAARILRPHVRSWVPVEDRGGLPGGPKDLLDRLNSLHQDVRNMMRRLDVVEAKVFEGDWEKKDKSTNAQEFVEFVTIQFSDPTKRKSAYERLTNLGVIYERLLFSCANVQKEGLKLLREYGFEFKEVDYSELLNRDPKGKDLRQTYLRAQRQRYGYSL